MAMTSLLSSKYSRIQLDDPLVSGLIANSVILSDLANILLPRSLIFSLVDLPFSLLSSFKSSKLRLVISLQKALHALKLVVV